MIERNKNYGGSVTGTIESYVPEINSYLILTDSITVIYSLIIK